MALKKFTLQPGNELRGFVIRLYPDKIAEDWLINQQHNFRAVWNWLVAKDRNHDLAVQSYAVKNGLVPSKPMRPDYSNVKSDESHVLKEIYHRHMSEWYKLLKKQTKDVECCKYVNITEWMKHVGAKWAYQFMPIVLKWHHDDIGLKTDVLPNSHMWQAFAQNFFQKSARPKRFRKLSQDMPIQTRSGRCFKLGNFGKRGQNESFYDCCVTIGNCRIRGRLPGKIPGGRVLEGVSITKQADGWYASVKVECPIRALPEPVAGSCIGIDVGLDNVAAMSDGTLVINQRTSDLSNQVAALQKRASATNDSEYAAAIKQKIARVHQRSSRCMRHIIYNEVIKPLGSVEAIKVEKLTSKIGQMGSAKVSVMRLIYRLLQERYGARVREVECAYTSQDCSNCGHRSKESWSYSHGPFGECNKCGHRAHRDINAARNIAARPVISQ